jgi:hypothetical protein
VTHSLRYVADLFYDGKNADSSAELRIKMAQFSTKTKTTRPGDHFLHCHAKQHIVYFEVMRVLILWIRRRVNMGLSGASLHSCCPSPAHLEIWLSICSNAKPLTKWHEATFIIQAT